MFLLKFIFLNFAKDPSLTAKPIFLFNAFKSEIITLEFSPTLTPLSYVFLEYKPVPLTFAPEISKQSLFSKTIFS